tara:strand:+ start:425 stop:2449 length:2025 start_codon:yes stop_codon:yes gene_type:complete
VSLKNPGELFEGKDPSVNVDESNHAIHIKEEFNRVAEISKQLNEVSNSLNSSLTEVVDKNLNFLSKDYSNQLEKFNNKINSFKEEINSKVDDVKKTNQDLRAEVQIVEQRQKNLEVNKALNKLKEEVLLEVNDIVTGVLEVNSENIKRLDGKVQVVRETYREMKILIRENINEGLLNEPPNTDNDDPLTPTDQKFATFEDLNKHYTLFLNRIQTQISTLGGGGAVNIRDLDDVDLSTAQVNNKFLKYDSSSAKWIGSDASGGSGSVPGISTTGTSFFNQIVASGVVTASSFSGTVPSSSLSGALPALDGSALTGVTGSGSGVVIKDSGSAVGTAGTINFSTNLSVTPIHLGIVTVTASGGGGGISTQFVAAETLTVAGVSTFSGNVIVSGSNLTLGDSSSTSDDRIVIGSGSDLHIFHNALDSHIDNNTGNLILRANVNSDVGGNIKLMPKASENGIIITHDASVELYENNVKKLETTSSGISVSGTCVATTFSGSGASLTDLDASNLSSGTVPTARLGSGTADNTKFLRGDNSWQTVSAGGSLGSRGDTSATTGSIAQNASADITIPTGGKSFSLLKVTINAPAWVVLYVSSSTRSSDSGRTEGTDPAPGSGVLTEVSTTTSGSSTFLMSPAVLGWNNDGTPASQIYAKVKNKRSNSGSNTITVTLTTVALET